MSGNPIQEQNQQGKQHTPEFETCIKNVMKQGHEKGSAFAICTTTFEKAQKPIFVGESESQKLHLFSESIKVKGHKVSGVAIHPKRIFHPEEGVEHVYLREELENAAPTLIGKPFGIDHMYVLPPPNVITNAWYDPAEDGVAFEGTVDDQIVEQISNKAFKGLSIELNWLRPGGRVEFANGVVPRNFELTSVHLLRNFPPGDKDAYIKFWNAIMEQLVLGPPRTIDDRVNALESNFKEMHTMLEVIGGKIDVLARVPPSSSVSGVAGARIQVVTIPIGERLVTLPKEQVMTEEDIKAKLLEIMKQIAAKETQNIPPEQRVELDALYSERRGLEDALTELAKQKALLKEAEWDAAFINDLPDSAFAAIGSGGQKDDQGKTTPRTLRHLPHHKADGSLDLAHLRNALARLPQTELSVEDKSAAQKHLCAHAKDSEIVSEVCGEKPPAQGESEQLKALNANLTETEGKLKELSGKLQSQEPSADIVKLRKDLVEAQARAADLTKDLAKTKEKFVQFVEAMKGTHPVLGVQRSWSLGPQKMIAEQLRVIREKGKVA